MGDVFPYVPFIPFFPGSTVDTCSRQSGMLWYGWFCRLRCTSRCAFRQREVQGWFRVSCVPSGIDRTFRYVPEVQFLDKFDVPVGQVARSLRQGALHAAFSATSSSKVQIRTAN